jgi:hypothetical protein
MPSIDYKEAEKQIRDYFANVTDEEFEQGLINSGFYSKRTCEPETCAGECQGMGSCQRCIDFRNEAGIYLPTLDEMCKMAEAREEFLNVTYKEGGFRLNSLGALLDFIYVEEGNV